MRRFSVDDFPHQRTGNDDAVGVPGNAVRVGRSFNAEPRQYRILARRFSHFLDIAALDGVAGKSCHSCPRNTVQESARSAIDGLNPVDRGCRRYEEDIGKLVLSE